MDGFRPIFPRRRLWPSAVTEDIRKNGKYVAGEAIQVAARIPSARLGGVEVRPVVDFSQEATAAAAGQQAAAKA